MKIDKIQKEIFNSMLKGGERTGRARVSETAIGFTYDGYRGFVLPDKLVNFNIDKIRDVPDMAKMFEAHENDKLLDITNDFRLLGDKRMARKLTCQPGEYLEIVDGKEVTDIWVNSKYLEYFRSPQLYSFGKNQRITVFDPMEPRLMGGVAGVILPIRMDH